MDWTMRKVWKPFEEKCLVTSGNMLIYCCSCTSSWVFSVKSALHATQSIHCKILKLLNKVCLNTLRISHAKDLNLFISKYRVMHILIKRIKIIFTHTMQNITTNLNMHFYTITVYKCCASKIIKDHKDYNDKHDATRVMFCVPNFTYGKLLSRRSDIFQG